MITVLAVKLYLLEIQSLKGLKNAGVHQAGAHHARRQSQAPVFFKYSRVTRVYKKYSLNFESHARFTNFVVVSGVTLTSRNYIDIVKKTKIYEK